MILINHTATKALAHSLTTKEQIPRMVLKLRYRWTDGRTTNHTNHIEIDRRQWRTDTETIKPDDNGQHYQNKQINNEITIKNQPQQRQQ